MEIVQAEVPERMVAVMVLMERQVQQIAPTEVAEEEAAVRIPEVLADLVEMVAVMVGEVAEEVRQQTVQTPVPVAPEQMVSLSSSTIVALT